MFDITSSKLLLLGIVALIVIGPKDLPVLLRTIGKYVGIIKRQAAEFRAQFEEAVRESELDQLKKDVESMGAEAEASMREAERTVTTELDAAQAEAESATNVSLLDKPADQHAHDADGLPIAPTETIAEDTQAASLNGGEPQGETEPRAESEPKLEPANGDARVEQKAGA
jgi:sec-independent protein translocase protein TatB